MTKRTLLTLLMLSFTTLPLYAAEAIQGNSQPNQTVLNQNQNQNANQNQNLNPNQNQQNANQNQNINAMLPTLTDKVSYTIGIEMGKNFKSQSIDVDPQKLLMGLMDGLNGKNPLLTREEMQQAILAFQKDIVAKQEAAFKAVSDQNQKEGSAFLAANQKKPGVKSFPDGLQYKILKQGTGPSPTAKDKVTVNYTGEFVNGKVFDSSYTRGKPVTFALDQVITGWQEALQHMQAGSIWEIYVPANLGYGENGLKGVIGPNSTLIFKIHLLSIEKAKA